MDNLEIPQLHWDLDARYCIKIRVIESTGMMMTGGGGVAVTSQPRTQIAHASQAI